MQNLKSTNNTPCLKCKSKNIIPDLQLIDQIAKQNLGQSKFKIQLIGDPDAVFNKEITSSKVNAFLCADCGFIELYADDPALIKEAYDRVLKKVSKTPKARSKHS
ncbi:MAG: hypothetical protein ABI844_07420 [Saprospiraceae bacterium]